MNQELFDIVDTTGTPTGAVITRSEAHATGTRHRTAHIWIVREKEGRIQVLLQRRALNKDSFPGKFDTSSAGHIQAGDEPLESALRELSEELGIVAQSKDLKFIDTFSIDYEKEFYGKKFKDSEIAFVYLYKKDIDINVLKLQKEEVDAVAWFDLEKIYSACQPPRDERFCVPMGGLELVRNYCKKKLNY